MPFTADYNKDKNCIMVEVCGELNPPLLHDLASSVSTIIAETGCRLIQNDLRKAHLPNGTLDIYNMPKIAQKAGVIPAIKRALIVGNREEEFYFLETVFINQGNNVKMFRSEDEAALWLFGSKITT